MTKIDKLRDLVDKSKRIVFFGGAGVSTESGIPDFRSSNGYYNRKSQQQMPLETVLSLGFFQEHPEIFYDYYMTHLVHEGVMPNRAHEALAKLEERGKLKAVITQNIDGLHQKAGSKYVLELHGTMYKNTCTKCHARYTLKEVRISYLCQKCGGVIKPDVILYDEPLDDLVYSSAIAEIASSDLLIIGGTSLVVYPAAYLIEYFRGKNLVLINRDETPKDHLADLVFREPIGKVLSSIFS